MELVIMDSCESLKNIFPASVAKGLQQLRELIVWNCEILEEIVANEGVETTPDLKNIFPASVAKGLQQLRELSVENCGILEKLLPRKE
ncbi:disease resistance protein [Prunus yedoensis var. nudiflora]|uniref:Disease resistance protein n=1 Tax=Prunus yedoensis var. nudiflora TaxID=2094558 RepID=A0A314YL58_PRUYE|nr:disease resistance protein [Prunus yedoensis var. nudiflora]